MTFASKLEKLEEEKAKLVEKRLATITKLAERAEVLAIEDELILGALLYVKQLQKDADKTKDTGNVTNQDNAESIKSKEKNLKTNAQISELRRLVNDKFPRRKSIK